MTKVLNKGNLRLSANSECNIPKGLEGWGWGYYQIRTVLLIYKHYSKIYFGLSN